MKKFVQALFAALTMAVCFIATLPLVRAQAANSTGTLSAIERMQAPGP